MKVELNGVSVGRTISCASCAVRMVRFYMHRKGIKGVTAEDLKKSMVIEGNTIKFSYEDKSQELSVNR